MERRACKIRSTNVKDEIDIAAERLLKIFEQSAKDLPKKERNAKWNAFNDTVSDMFDSEDRVAYD